MASFIACYETATLYCLCPVNLKGLPACSSCVLSLDQCSFFVTNNSLLYRAFFWCSANSWKHGTPLVIFPPLEQRIKTIVYYVQRHKTKYCQANTVIFVVIFTVEKTCSRTGNNLIGLPPPVLPLLFLWMGILVQSKYLANCALVPGGLATLLLWQAVTPAEGSSGCFIN